MNKIKKTLTITEILAKEITVKDGELSVTDLMPCYTTEKVTESNALKKFIAHSGYEGDASNIKVMSINKTTKTYVIDVDTFIKYAAVEKK